MTGDAPSRLRLSRRDRTFVLRTSGFCCSICARPLGAADVHHVEFLSVGGPDTLDNLVALCPNCHRNMAHGLYRSERGRMLIRHACDEWASVNADQRRDDLHNIDKAEKLLAPESRATILRAGAYSWLAATAKALASNLSEMDHAPEIQALWLELMSLVMGMSYYTGRDTAHVVRLQDALVRTDPSNEFALARNEVRLALSRLLRLYGQVQAERSTLDDFEEAGASAAQLDDWDFRSTSHEFRAFGSTGALMSFDPERDLRSSGDYRALATATMEADIGLATFQSDHQAGLDWLINAFDHAYATVARRAMLTMALKLSQAWLHVGNGRVAAGWLLIANAVGPAGVLTEFTIEDLAADLERNFGKSPSELWGDRPQTVDELLLESRQALLAV